MRVGKSVHALLPVPIFFSLSLILFFYLLLSSLAPHLDLHCPLHFSSNFSIHHAHLFFSCPCFLDLCWLCLFLSLPHILSSYTFCVIILCPYAYIYPSLSLSFTANLHPRYWSAHSPVCKVTPVVHWSLATKWRPFRGVPAG